jgi:hypothetical protein
VSATLNQADYQTVWSDNFTQDSSLNTGIFSRQWGDGSEFSFNNGLTLTSDGNAAGFLTQDGSAADSTGYGLYEATVSVPSNNQQPGIAVTMWPATNQWPGPEIDLVEQINGQAYMTVHWADSSGNNDYSSTFLPNVDLTKPTTLAMDWESGSLTYYVNGQEVTHFASGGSVPIPSDAADGGQNEAFGAEVSSTYGSQLTLYDMSYSQYTGSSSESGSSSNGGSTAITPDNTNPTTANFASSGDSSAGYAQSLATAAGTDILQGGYGLDTFAVDATNPDGWAEIDNFHSGDVLSILGFVAGQSTITWTTTTDPNGQSGATADISLAGNGTTNMAITFAGVSQSDAQNFGSGNWWSGNGTPELNLWHV